MALSSKNPLFPRFSLTEYEKNPAAIKRVNDSALEYLETLREALEKKEALLKKKDEEIASAKTITLVDVAQPFFLVVGAVIFGYGVNITTASPNALFGWILSFFGCAIQLIAIFVSLLVKLKRRT